MYCIILDYFGSEDRFNEMTFVEKRNLLKVIFGGKDEDGRPYGIYVKKRGNDKWDYTISAELFCGTRTLFGNDIDSDAWEPPDSIKEIIEKVDSGNWPQKKKRINPKNYIHVDWNYLGRKPKYSGQLDTHNTNHNGRGNR